MKVCVLVVYSPGTPYDEVVENTKVFSSMELGRKWIKEKADEYLSEYPENSDSVVLDQDVLDLCGRFFVLVEREVE